MRRFQLLLISLCLLSACSNLPLGAPPEKVIVGTWILQSATFNGQEMTADQIGGPISFTFTEEGTAVFQTSEGKTEEGRYEIDNNQLIDPDSPANTADILKLNRKEFVVAMAESGGIVVMNFRPQGR